MASNDRKHSEYKDKQNLMNRSGVLEDVLKDSFEVLDLGLEGQVLGLEASSPQKLACPRLDDSTIF